MTPDDDQVYEQSYSGPGGYGRFLDFGDLPNKDEDVFQTVFGDAGWDSENDYS
jgi:hypothetical protein